jgi:hypothetical protein
MRVLIACEESQTVCIEFRKLGHEAYSCDIQDCSGGHPEWHIKDDVLNHLSDGWDMMIGHPVCTRLCLSGVQWLHKRNLWNEMEKAAEFFNKLLNAPIEKICLENPIQHFYARQKIRKYDQIIHPWMFGHPEQKTTCLWLKKLEKLKETNNVYEYMMTLSVKERNRILWLGSGKDRERSKTFLGIAKAFAEQWGGVSHSQVFKAGQFVQVNN